MEISTEFWIQLVITVGGLGSGFGIMKNKLDNVSTKIDDQKIDFENQLKAHKKDHKETLKEFKNDIKEDINRLEEAQKKYNNLQERVVLAEALTKSAHHRLDTIDRQHEIEKTS